MARAPRGTHVTRCARRAITTKEHEAWKGNHKSPLCAFLLKEAPWCRVEIARENRLPPSLDQAGIGLPPSRNSSDDCCCSPRLCPRHGCIVSTMSRTDDHPPADAAALAPAPSPGAVGLNSLMLLRQRAMGQRAAPPAAPTASERSDHPSASAAAGFGAGNTTRSAGATSGSFGGELLNEGTSLFLTPSRVPDFLGRRLLETNL